MPRASTATLPRLLIRSSEIHAAGCYTMDAILNGRRVAEYDGPRITKAVADQRYADRPVTYLFGVDGRSDVIDGFGAAMFINHSCSPNCETESRDGRVFIRAVRNIAAGEELLYEYNLYDSDETPQDCYCGATNCRGTMFSDWELQRQARAAKRKAAKESAK